MSEIAAPTPPAEVEKQESPKRIAPLKGHLLRRARLIWVLAGAFMVLSAWAYVHPRVNIPVISPLVCDARGHSWFPGRVEYNRKYLGDMTPTRIPAGCLTPGWSL